MPFTQEQAAWFSQTFNVLAENVGQALLGKDHVVRLALTCMLSEGHLLLEDAPGTGKTALARAIAASVSGTHSRIQFTPDLLPSDITGITMYNQQTRDWEFHKGPVFASIVLADEINRASPKTQSALLEVMEEAKVTVDGVSHEADRPFMVIATQNPVEQAGTYKLPEAQLDRFLMKTAIGYPDEANEIEILAGSASPDRSKQLKPVIMQKAVNEMIAMVASNYVDPAVLTYVRALAHCTRVDTGTLMGVSIRGAISMVRAARVWAASQGRNYVLPDDIQTLAEPVWTHRIIMSPDAEFSGATAADVIKHALASIPAPVTRS